MRLALIVQAGPEEAARFCADHGLAGLCIPDPTKQTHRSAGLERESWSALFRPSDRVRAAYRSAMRGGEKVSFRQAFLRASDWRQLPGAALVGRSGEVLWLHHGADVADLPPVETLIEVASQYVLQR